MSTGTLLNSREVTVGRCPTLSVMLSGTEF